MKAVRMADGSSDEPEIAEPEKATEVAAGVAADGAEDGDSRRARLSGRHG